MSWLIRLGLTLLQLMLCNAYTTDFCRLECGDEHTVCKRNPCGPAIKCGSNVKMVPLSMAERDLLTYYHNKLRHEVALNWFKMTVASNMKIMSYSRQLEFVAQCWANACKTDRSNDKCRETDMIGIVGQNIFILHKYYADTAQDSDLLYIAFHKWKQQNSDFNVEWLHAYDKTMLKYKEFIQMIWSQTIFFGCGRIVFGSYVVSRFLLVCNYSPGIEEGAPIFKLGKPCSDCENGTCNAVFTHLCGEPRPPEDDKWNPPFVMYSDCTKHHPEFIVYFTVFVYMMIIIKL